MVLRLKECEVLLAQIVQTCPLHNGLPFFLYEFIFSKSFWKVLKTFFQKGFQAGSKGRALGALPFLPLVQSRPDDGAETGVFGDDEPHSEVGGKPLEHPTDGGDGGEVARQHDICNALAPRGEDGHHEDGLRHHVGDAQGNIVTVGQIAEIAEVGGGEVDAHLGELPLLGDILDGQVDLAQVAALAELLDVGNGVHAQDLFGQTQEGTAAHARTAQILNGGGAVGGLFWRVPEPYPCPCSR